MDQIPFDPVAVVIETLLCVPVTGTQGKVFGRMGIKNNTLFQSVSADGHQSMGMRTAMKASAPPSRHLRSRHLASSIFKLSQSRRPEIRSAGLHSFRESLHTARTPLA
jgi:hypothetical protein